MGKFVRNVDNAGYLAADKAECSWHVYVLLPDTMCYHGISPHCWSVKEAIVGLARANGPAGPGWVVVVLLLCVCGEGGLKKGGVVMLTGDRSWHTRPCRTGRTAIQRPR
jgi:hypothetical protein